MSAMLIVVSVAAPVGLAFSAVLAIQATSALAARRPLRARLSAVPGVLRVYAWVSRPALPRRAERVPEVRP